MIADEAQRLRLSATPVREALARLAGEGLIIEAPSGGYMRPHIGAGGIRDRYDLHEIYTQAALAMVASFQTERAAARPLPWTNGNGESDPYAIEGFFDRLVRRAGNKALEEAHRNLSLQLRAIRNIEKLILDGVSEEVDQLHQLARDGRWSDLHERVAAYHLRRRDASMTLAYAFHRSSPQPPDANGAA